MCSQQLLEVGFKPWGKPQAVLLVIYVFLQGKDYTGIGLGLGIGGDCSNDGAYCHRYVHMAKKPLLLAVRYDLRDLLQVAHFDGNDPMLDIFRTRAALLVHDIVET